MLEAILEDIRNLYISCKEECPTHSHAWSQLSDDDTLMEEPTLSSLVDMDDMSPPVCRKRKRQQRDTHISKRQPYATHSTYYNTVGVYIPKLFSSFNKRDGQTAFGCGNNTSTQASCAKPGHTDNTDKNTYCSGSDTPLMDRKQPLLEGSANFQQINHNQETFQNLEPSHIQEKSNFSTWRSNEKPDNSHFQPTQNLKIFQTSNIHDNLIGPAESLSDGDSEGNYFCKNDADLNNAGEDEQICSIM